MCDFLLVIKTNLHRILHRFQDIEDCWSLFRRELHVFNTLVQGEPQNSGPQNLAIKKLERSLVIWCCYVYIYRRLFRFVTKHSFDRWTDRQTESQQQECTL